MRLPGWLKKSPNKGQAPSSPWRFRPQLEGLETRVVPYAVSGNAWPHPELVTISFMPDGTVLNAGTSGTVTSNLFSTFNAKFGSPAAWENLILKAAQTWAQQTNLNFAVVPDDGSAAGSGLYQQGDPGKGDIRIGGYNFGTSTLAQAFQPPPVNNYSIAGDIQINTGQTFNVGSTYDLYSVMLHEIGHTLGMNHSKSTGAIMYASYQGVKRVLGSDDIAGIRSIYSNGGARSPDAYNSTTPDNSFTAAADLTSAVDATALTAVANNLDITTAGQAEYFTVTAPAATTGSLTVTAQSSGLSLLAPTLTVYDAKQNQLGFVSGAGQYGTTLNFTLHNVTPGQQLYLKVAGADASAFGTGRYALTLNFGSGPAPAVSLPNTLTPNGATLSVGGGIAAARIAPLVPGPTDADNDPSDGYEVGDAQESPAFASWSGVAPAPTWSADSLDAAFLLVNDLAGRPAARETFNPWLATAFTGDVSGAAFGDVAGNFVPWDLPLTQSAGQGDGCPDDLGLVTSDAEMVGAG